MIFKGSRYEKVPTRTIVDASGRVIAYKGLRALPDATGAVGHRVTDHERDADLSRDRAFGHSFLLGC